jgi:hypothetical protein
MWRRTTKETLAAFIYGELEAGLTANCPQGRQ